MRTPTIATSALALAGFAAAANFSAPASYNSYPQGFTTGSAPEAGSQSFIDASNNANASNTVFFRHGPPTDNSSVAGNWTWTIKVSDVVVPVNSSQGNAFNPLPANAHVAYTSYEFTWPEDGNLDDALYDEARAVDALPVPSCAYIFTAQFPANVSKKFDEGSDSNCTNILGAECVKNLTALASYGTTDCSTGRFPISGPAFEAACGGSLGAVLGYGWQLGGFQFGNASAASNSSGTHLEKGTTYAYSLSEAYSADNLTVYNQAKDNVNIMLLTDATYQLVCNRAGNGSSLTGAAAGRSGLGLGVVGVVAVLAAMFNML